MRLVWRIHADLFPARRPTVVASPRFRTLYPTRRLAIPHSHHFNPALPLAPESAPSRAAFYTLRLTLPALLLLSLINSRSSSLLFISPSPPLLASEELCSYAGMAARRERTERERRCASEAALLA